MSCAAAPQELGVFSLRISFFLFFFLPIFIIYVSSGVPKGYVLLFAVTVEGAPVGWTGILLSCLSLPKGSYGHGDFDLPFQVPRANCFWM